MALGIAPFGGSRRERGGRRRERRENASSRLTSHSTVTTEFSICTPNVACNPSRGVVPGSICMADLVGEAKLIGHDIYLIAVPKASPGGTGIPSIEIIPSQKPTEVDRRYRAALGMDSAEGREGITLGPADHGKADYPSGWRTSSFARPHKLKHVLPGTVRLSS